MKLGKRIRAVANALPDILREGGGAAGAALVSYGSWEIYHPAGLIVGGILLLVMAERLARAQAATGSAEE